jgi:hypothetical protein
MMKDRRACITIDTFLIRTVLISIPWSTDVDSSLLGFLQILGRVNPVYGFPSFVMALDVVLHPDATTGVFSGVMFLGEEGSASWASRPTRIR